MAREIPLWISDVSEKVVTNLASSDDDAKKLEMIVSPTDKKVHFIVTSDYSTGLNLNSRVCGFNDLASAIDYYNNL